MIFGLTEVHRERHRQGSVAIPGKALNDTDEARGTSIMPFDTTYVPKLSMANASALADEYSHKMPPFPIPFYRSMRAPSVYRLFSFL